MQRALRQELHQNPTAPPQQDLAPATAAVVTLAHALNWLPPAANPPWGNTQVVLESGLPTRCGSAQPIVVEVLRQIVRNAAYSRIARTPNAITGL